MRALQTHDVFKALRLVNTLGVREEVKNIATSIQSGKRKINQQEIGLDFILTIVGNAGSEQAENAVYDFLSGPLEIDPNEMRTMDPLELMEKVKALSSVIDAEGWRNFFASVASMMTSN